jgi:hypothetical protein
MPQGANTLYSANPALNASFLQTLQSVAGKAMFAPPLALGQPAGSDGATACATAALQPPSPSSACPAATDGAAPTTRPAADAALPPACPAPANCFASAPSLEPPAGKPAQTTSTELRCRVPGCSEDLQPGYGTVSARGPLLQNRHCSLVLPVPLYARPFGCQPAGVGATSCQ